ncbi:hypothetical protein MMC09_004189 [Bachmanniomyces sp. S44760]|nr:hypothetical protein [Bachmanniomyces sp. S44760]
MDHQPPNVATMAAAGQTFFVDPKALTRGELEEAYIALVHRVKDLEQDINLPESSPHMPFAPSTHAMPSSLSFPYDVHQSFQVSHEHTAMPADVLSSEEQAYHQSPYGPQPPQPNAFAEAAASSPFTPGPPYEPLNHATSHAYVPQTPSQSTLKSMSVVQPLLIREAGRSPRHRLAADEIAWITKYMLRLRETTADKNGSLPLVWSALTRDFNAAFPDRPPRKVKNLNYMTSIEDHRKMLNVETDAAFEWSPYFAERSVFQATHSQIHPLDAAHAAMDNTSALYDGESRNGDGPYFVRRNGPRLTEAGNEHLASEFEGQCVTTGAVGSEFEHVAANTLAVTAPAPAPIDPGLAPKTSTPTAGKGQKSDKRRFKLLEIEKTYILAYIRQIVRQSPPTSGRIPMNFRELLQAFNDEFAGKEIDGQRRPVRDYHAFYHIVYGFQPAVKLLQTKSLRKDRRRKAR